MADVNDLKRIVVEDFSKDDQALVEKLAFAYNPMTEKLVAAFNHGIDFNNLNQQYVTFTVTTTDAQGTLATPTQLRYELKTRLKGCQVISATNLDSDAHPLSAPFIGYSLSKDQITIEYVVGLPTNTKFSLSAILYG